MTFIDKVLMNRQKQFRINAENWNEARQRYLNQGWRARIFCDLIISDISSMPTSGRPTLLDIGCGKGFDCDLTLSEEMAKSAGRIIGIEPDPNVRLAPYFTETHQCIFEQAPLPSSSVDLAWAVMVLEHLERPELFWDKLSQVLKPGGIFWGITVDARHWFVWGSQMMESLRVKDAYLNVVRGTRGVDRYENYPVYYRSNTLKALRY
ncbi:MAG: hypothetical protein COW13_03930, partial [Candidatus Omnitrophica bacterium CG12_big_fil_rev_8_21_14_0_65_50_5]